MSGTQTRSVDIDGNTGSVLQNRMKRFERDTVNLHGLLWLLESNRQAQPAGEKADASKLRIGVNGIGVYRFN